MKELVRLCEAAGCRNVQTYIQSGNVIFTAEPHIAAALPAQLPFPTLLRTPAELDAVIAANPYPPEHSHVVFLFEPPALPLPVAHPPEAITADGLHLYLYLPHGVGRSKLAAASPQGGTMRNWRTVTKLRELMAGLLS